MSGASTCLWTHPKDSHRRIEPLSHMTTRSIPSGTESPSFFARRPDLFRVLFHAVFAPDNACRKYRISNLCDEMNRLGIARGHVVDVSMPIEEYHKYVAASDALVFQRPQIPNLLRAIRSYRLSSKMPLVVVEDDDNAWKTSPMNSAYAAYGEEEVAIRRDGVVEPLWRHGQTDGDKVFDIHRNRHLNRCHWEATREAELVTVAGDGLADFVRNQIGNDNVATVPNYIDFHTWRKLDLRKDPHVRRVCWMGGASHYDDLSVMIRGLKEAMHRDPRIQFIMYGQPFVGWMRELPAERVRHERWVHVEAHPYKMASLNVDVALIPLIDDEFGRGKSFVKWSEWSSLEVPSIVSGAQVYDVVEHGVTGLRATDQKGWCDAILRLTTDETFRRRIGRNAYSWHQKHLRLDRGVRDYIALLNANLLAKRRGKFLDGREFRSSHSRDWWRVPRSPVPDVRGGSPIPQRVEGAGVSEALEPHGRGGGMRRDPGREAAHSGAGAAHRAPAPG